MRFWETPTYRRIVLGVLFAAVIGSLATTTYFFFHTQATRSVTHRFDYGEARFERYEEVRKEWRPRVGSTLLVRSFHTPDRREMRDRVALWFAVWMAVVAMVYALTDRRAALFMAAGTFAALVYACSPITENTWYPWDMPALFFGALTLLFARRRWAVPLAVAVVLAVPFKETILLMGLFFLGFDHWPWRKRLGWAVATVAVGYGLRLGLEAALGNPMGAAALSYHVHADPSMPERWRENLDMVLSLTPNHVLWANLGTAAVIFLLPARDAVLRVVKWIAVPFYAGLFVAGSLNEVRIFLEILPGALLLAAAFVRDTATAERRPAA